jgi:hypothetical protein
MSKALIEELRKASIRDYNAALEDAAAIADMFAQQIVADPEPPASVVTRLTGEAIAMAIRELKLKEPE